MADVGVWQPTTFRCNRCTDPARLRTQRIHLDNPTLGLSADEVRELASVDEVPARPVAAVARERESTRVSFEW